MTACPQLLSICTSINLKIIQISDKILGLWTQRQLGRDLHQAHRLLGKAAKLRGSLKIYMGKIPRGLNGIEMWSKRMNIIFLILFFW